MNVHLGGAVDVACRAERTHTLQVVVTTAAAKDIAHDKAAVHADVGSAALGDGHSLRALAATTYAANLTTAIEAVAHHATIDRHVGAVYVAVVYIAAAEDVSGLEESVLADDAVIRHIVGSRLVMDLLAVTLIDVGCRQVIGASFIVGIADVAVIEGDVGRAKDGTTLGHVIFRFALAAGVGITLNSGDAVSEGGAGLVANHHVGLTVEGLAAHITLPSCAIDVTAGATLDVGIGRGSKALRVAFAIISADTKDINHLA